MFRHPRYLEIPWEVHWNHNEARSHHHLFLMAILIVLAMFLIGVGVTSGLM
ncbi:MAG TPA: hypothetical protein VFU48_07700 [Nitrospira sp.]|nr:hypothetical protein [Nitrospira sp.]